MKNSKKTFLKLLIFIGAISLFILIFNYVLMDNYYKSYIDNINNINVKIKNSKYYFVGSSRVQSSINPENVEKIFTKGKIANLGMSSSLFISNCILTSSIINSNKGVYFIELSPDFIEFSKGLILFTEERSITLLKELDDLFQNENRYNAILYKLKLLKKYYSNQFSIQGKLKHLFIESKDTIVGYKVHKKISKINTVSSFLTYDEIYNNKTELRSISYNNYINYLMKLGKKHDSKIIFFLPVTSKTPEEKKIIISVFNSLHDSLKISFSKEFLKKISKSDYLYDRNHLNSEGARVYSKWLGEYLVSMFSD